MMFKMYTFIEYLVTIYIILYVQVAHTRIFLIQKTERVTSVQKHTQETPYTGEKQKYIMYYCRLTQNYTRTHTEI